MQDVGLPIIISHRGKRGNGRIKHSRRGILELLVRIGIRLDIAFGGKQGTDHAGHLAKQTHARLHEFHGSGEDLTFAVGQRIPGIGGHDAVTVQVRHGTVQEILRFEHADVLGIDGDGLVDVETGRIGLDVTHVELLDHLVHGEHVTIRSDGPAQQCQIVQQAFTDETVVAMQEQVGFRIALGQLLVALAHHIRHVAEQRHLLGDAQLDQIPIQHDLTRGGAQQILTAQHYVDVHHGIVDRVGQRVQRITVRTHDHVIRYGTGLEFDAATDQIVEGDIIIGHTDAQSRLTAFCAEGRLLLFGEIAIVAIVAKGLRTTGGHVTGLDLFRSGEGFIGIAGFEQLGRHILVDLGALGLAVRTVWTTHVDAFIPVDAQPVQGFDDLVIAFLGVTLGVRILDTEHERALSMAGFGPVEQCGTDHANVRDAGRRRAETHADILGEFRFGVFSFSHRLHCAALTGRVHEGGNRLSPHRNPPP